MALGLLQACGIVGSGQDTLRLTAGDYRDIEGWREADLRPSLAAFAISCHALRNRETEEEVIIGGQAVSLSALRWPCLELQTWSPFAENPAAIRQFFERYFQPYAAIASVSGTEAFFTGYYEIELEASPSSSPDYPWPIWERPAGAASETLPSRREIEQGALEGKAKALAWAKDWVALYFLHIQGSGVLRFPDGRRVRVQYDGKNGQPYRSIGKMLIERGEITREAMTAPVLQNWLRRHPQEGRELTWENASYVFFRSAGEMSPVGAAGVALTPGYSLAVDPGFYRYGLPLWINTMLPAAQSSAPRHLRRLCVAQDTGSAIRGPLRADIFFGSGEEAEFLAGHLQSPGRIWVLLPKPLPDKER